MPVLHRRRTSSFQSAAGAPQPSPSSSTAPQNLRPNLSYQPLRRPSTQLYSTQPVSARYTLPPSPNALAGEPYGAFGSGLDLGNSSPGGSAGARDWREAVRLGGERLREGVRDAVRLDRSWNLVWGDLELRTLVLKSTLINLLSLLLLSLFPVILSPLISANAAGQLVETRTKEVGLWYNVLLSWPVFVVCFWVNTLVHPAYRQQPSSSSFSSASPAQPFDAVAWARTSVNRILLISDFTLVTRGLALVPVVGRPLAFAYMCIINAYYSFEWTFVARQWALDQRADFVADRPAYMLGFGLVATLVSSFGPPLVNMACFALIYPFALQSRPPMSSTSGLLTPSSPVLTPSSPGFETDPFAVSAGKSMGLTAGTARGTLRFPTSLAQLRLPIFVLARYGIEAVAWVEEALGRDRSGAGGYRRRRERAGKRPM